MKRKFKFVSLVLSMIMCFTLMILGVYAATTTTLTINNKVSFTAYDQVNCIVTYKVTGGVDAGNINNINPEGQLAKFVTKNVDSSCSSNQTGTVPDLVFTNNNDETTPEEIVISFIFENTGDNTIYVSWKGYNPDSNNTNVVVTSDSVENLTTTGDSIEISGHTQHIFTLTYTVDDPLVDAYASFNGLVFTLESKEANAKRIAPVA